MEDNAELLRQLEDIDFDAAVQASILDSTRMVTATSNSNEGCDDQDYQQALLSSLSDPTLNQPINSMTTKEVILPEGSNILSYRYDLQWELGAKLIDGGSRKLIVSAQDPDVTAIAALKLQEYIADPSTLIARREEKIHIFVDNSNIFLGAQYMANSRDPFIRIRQDAIAGLVTRGRHAIERHVFGSKPPRNNEIWNKWKKQNFHVHCQDRAPGHGEQFLDDAIASAIKSAILKYREESSRHTILLLTGDGNDNQGRGGFPEVVTLGISFGFKFEIWTWQHSTSRHYIELRNQFAPTGLFQLHYFDPHRPRITINLKRAPRSATAQTDLTATAVVDDAAEEDEFIDIFSLGIIQNPVRAPNGRHYDKSGIEAWLTTNPTDPMSRQSMSVADILPPDAEFAARLTRYRVANSLD